MSRNPADIGGYRWSGWEAQASILLSPKYHIVSAIPPILAYGWHAERGFPVRLLLIDFPIEKFGNLVEEHSRYFFLFFFIP